MALDHCSDRVGDHVSCVVCFRPIPILRKGPWMPFLLIKLAQEARGWHALAGALLAGLQRGELQPTYLHWPLGTWPMPAGLFSWHAQVLTQGRDLEAPRGYSGAANTAHPPERPWALVLSALPPWMDIHSPWPWPQSRVQIYSCLRGHGGVSKFDNRLLLLTYNPNPPFGSLPLWKRRPDGIVAQRGPEGILAEKAKERYEKMKLWHQGRGGGTSGGGVHIRGLQRGGGKACMGVCNGQ